MVGSFGNKNRALTNHEVISMTNIEIVITRYYKYFFDFNILVGIRLLSMTMYIHIIVYGLYFYSNVNLKCWSVNMAYVPKPESRSKVLKMTPP